MKTPNQTADILTFEEWVANSVCVCTSAGNVRVVSLQASKIFYWVNQTFVVCETKPILDELNRGVRSETLKEIYTMHYDWIQEQHQKQLKKYPISS